MQPAEGGDHRFQVRHLDEQMVVIGQQTPCVGIDACFGQGGEQIMAESCHPIRGAADDVGMFVTGGGEMKTCGAFDKVWRTVPRALELLPVLQQGRLVFFRELPPAVHGLQGVRCSGVYVVHALACQGECRQSTLKREQRTFND